MTREEAIRRMKCCRDFLANNYSDMGEPNFTAFNMAIQALSQEPSRDMEEIAEIMKCDADAETKCKMISNILTAKPHYFKEQEPCDDAISREWLMRKATERFYTTNYFNHISAMIEEAPSVTQKSGKWIAHSDGGIWIKYYECSECKRGHNTHSDYCPNCGAKMFEPKESEVQTE